MMRVNSPGPDGACGAACDGGSTDGATGLDAIGVAGGNGAVLEMILGRAPNDYDVFLRRIIAERSAGEARREQNA